MSDQLDDEMAAFIKGMLLRGDKQSDIAACFMINGGRIAEINTGQRFADITAAPANALPPQPPYASPYERWKSQHEIWRLRVALEEVLDHTQRSLIAVHKIEQR